jgi:putative ABC transport system permease protein
MFIRLVKESIARNPRRKLIAGIALVLGMTVATATLTVAVDVGDQLAREFRSFGANLLVTPQQDTLPVEIGGVDYRPVTEGAYLSVADLPKLKTIFWRHNILGFAPFLDVPVNVTTPGHDNGDKKFSATVVGTWHKHSLPVDDGSGTFTTGAAATSPWWKVDGHWFNEQSQECLAGAQLAERNRISPGDRLNLSSEPTQQVLPVTITGIVTTGDSQDDAIVCPLALAQTLAGKPGQFRQLSVNALTIPEDAFSRRDPNTMTPTEFDRWYCTPYISSIANQIQQIFPGTHVQTVRRIAQTEGTVLSHVSLLFWMITIAALIAAVLAIAATSTTTAIERRSELGLMKALGATNLLIGALFLSEQLLIALVGGCIGFAIGAGLARELGETVFGIPAAPRLLVLPVILVAAAVVVLLGSWIPLYRASHISPAPVLRGE